MKEKAKLFRTLLAFAKDRQLVALRFLYTEEEYAAQKAPEATHQMFFCMMVKAAAVGHGFKVKKEHLYCSAAAEVLGFSEPADSVRTGQAAYARKMYESMEVAAGVAKDLPCLKHKVYGMLIQPLQHFVQEPDVVLCFCRPYTAMRIIQAYSYQYGFAPQIRMAGMGGVCTELTARAYQQQDIQISLLCSGTRFAAEWRDDELGIAFPYHIFCAVSDGVYKTMNTFEADASKRDIQERASENGLPITPEYGKNYHGSALGAARMGVQGYRKKKQVRMRKDVG